MATELNINGEHTWQELKGHLEWADNFELIFLFSDNPALPLLFYQRSRYVFSGQLAQTQYFKPDNPDSLVTDTLDFIDNLAEKPTPVWLEFCGLKQDEQYEKPEQVLIAMLQRLNERRERLRQKLSLALVISLPAVMAKETLAIAPDLWSIRSVSFNLSAKALMLLPDAGMERASISPSSTDLSVEEHESQPVKEWLRIKDRFTDKKLDKNVLALSYQVIQHLLSNPQQVSLEQIFSWLENKVSGGQIMTEGQYLAFMLLAELYKVKGLYRQARDYYQQALNSAREEQKLQGDTPELLRDISISLNKVGDMARAQGEPESAADYYRQSLAIRQQLQQLLGDTPEVLRDISVSLNKVGDMAWAQGEPESAADYYRQSLAIARQLQQLLGDTPQVLSDISYLEEKLR